MRSRYILVYDAGKIYVNIIGRKFDKFKQYSIRPCCFVCIERFNYLIYLCLPWKLDVSQNPRSLFKRLLLWLQHWDGFCKIQWVFYCSSKFKLEIRVFDWEGLLSRGGLYDIYKVEIRNSFFSVVFKDSFFFGKVMLISFDSSINENGFDYIPNWFNFFFVVTFRKSTF